jgi:hypothetical protein
MFFCQTKTTRVWVAVCLWGISSPACSWGQLRPIRQTGGWLVSSSTEPTTEIADENLENSPAGGNTDVQLAYFQSPGGYPNGLPVLPSGGPPAQSGTYPQGNVYPDPQGLQGLPASPPSLPSAPNYNNQAVLPPGYPPGYVSGNPPVGNSPVLPLKTNELRAIDERAASVNAPAPAYNQSSGQPRTNEQNITTGLPHVTPPPRGRYATSPYVGPIYQTASYQTIATGPAGQPAALPTASPTYLTPQQASLPQYQQAGIYQTTYQQCAPPAPSFPSTGAVPGAFVPPTLTPNLTPGLYTPNNAGFSPLLSLGQENYNVLLGRGILGQPTAYVPGQPVRNFMRYIFP